MTQRPITKLLIANRGEIACRVMRTARQMSIATVAVYSDVDAGAQHVRVADEAVALPGSTAAATYLNVDALIDAARSTGADAVHPGYGFLSERAEFARACGDAGLVFVGPPAEAIAAMGNKVAAKARMAEAGVPVLPGVTLDADAAGDALLAAGDRVGYPLLVKAAFGGGGRGMRVVMSSDELDDAVESARREAAAAFGDGLVFLERYVINPRHIEVQVLADTHGNTLHLFERECSIQRRHQKVIEEAPSIAVGDELRAQLGEAAVTAARAIGYVNVGTVEFVMTPTNEFFFLEVNTRLQVEHPVTELVSGLDLVRMQLEIANGEPLPGPAFKTTIFGHAVEARLYAEDVPAGFLPTSGRFDTIVISEDVAGDGIVRVDGGYESGDTVSTYYDALLAKVIAWSPSSRQAAIDMLATALRRARLHGPRTNRDLLVRTLEHPEFAAGKIDTGFYERHDAAVLGRPLPDAAMLRRLAIAAALDTAHREVHSISDVPYGFRNVGPGWVATTYSGDVDCTIELRQTRRRAWQARIDGAVHDVAFAGSVFRLDGEPMRVEVEAVGDEYWIDSGVGSAHLVEVPRLPPPGASDAEGSLHTPLPGTVVRVDVAVGDTVRAGDVLVVLEAMKMEHTVRAPHDGVVTELDVGVGSQVVTGAVLVVVEAT